MPPTTIADLLALLTREPGRPRITWYAADGDRVELSGAVLDNWVSKTTNLLVEELDVEPGTRVLLDLPTHWRTLVWQLAVWRAGGCVVLPGGPRTDVVVTDSPAQHVGSHAQLVAVSLPALARRFLGDLPPGALDAAASVMTYGDVIGWAPEPAPTDPAMDPGPTHGELVAWALATQPDGPDRVLVAAGPGRTSEHDVARVLGVLARGGSVVLVDDALSKALDADPDRAARLVASERITVSR
ncbi:TIGR03089 family protein [Cellulomonas sp. URHD0024]|uniref:TIGR03089 family protein n=1 Tax=Cellulomonas sp. URHD0024 TaxID=1302620 RepID=UPI000410E2CD|nr:TIGR03089 family protein [Cellulomonas sp. URHD0024]